MPLFRLFVSKLSIICGIPRTLKIALNSTFLNEQVFVYRKPFHFESTC